MGQSQLSAKQVRASFSINGGSVGVNSIRVSQQINQWPQIQVGIVLGVDNTSGSLKAYQIDHTVLQKLISVAQDRDQVTLSFGVEDANATVQGFIQAGGIQQTPRDVGFSVNVLPDYAGMDILNLSYLKNVADEDIDDWDEEESSENIFTFIKTYYQKLQKTWKNETWPNMQSSVSNLERITIETTMQRNSQYEKYFLELLQNSEKALQERGSDLPDTYNFKKLYKYDDTFLCSNLKKSILNCLTAENNTFLSNLTSLANEFRLVYVPQINNVGKFVFKSDIVSQGNDNENLKVEIESIVANIGSLGVYPIGGVCTSIQNEDIDDIGISNLNQIIISYPRQAELGKDGSIVKIACPSWMPESLFVQEISSKSDLQKNKPKVSKVKELKSESKKQKDSKKEEQLTILEQWCQQEYLFLRYATNTAQITTFFILPTDAFGTVKNIMVSNKKMCTGFVSGIEQFMQFDQQVGRVNTLLNISHIQV